MSTALPASKPQNPNLPASNNNPNQKGQATGTVPTLSIKSSSQISSKVRQCLDILRPPQNANESKLGAATQKSRPKPRIVALKAVDPAAGSKTITIAEIVKRSIAEGDENHEKAVWWQYTKLESQLIEWPPKKYEKVEPAIEKEEDETVVASNINKRKQEGADERAAKKRRLENRSQKGSQRSSTLPTSSNSVQKPRSKRQKVEIGDVEEKSYEEAEEDDSKPPHLRDSSPNVRDSLHPPQSSTSIDKPAHLRDTSPAVSSDDRPSHLRDSSPDLGFSDKPAHLRDSSPAAESDGRPAHLQDSSAEPTSDDRPLHLRDSSPTTPKASRVVASDDDRPRHLLSSSPPGPQPPKPYVESDDEMSEASITQDKAESSEESEEDEDDDEYRRFTYLDIDRLPEKHTKRLLAELDAAERNRKKYRAIAVMTVLISLEKRADLEKLYGFQTNSEGGK